MLIKRLILALISIVFGVSVTFLIMIFVLHTDYYTFGFGYTFFTILALACFLGIWVEKFMGIELVPD